LQVVGAGGIVVARGEVIPRRDNELEMCESVKAICRLGVKVFDGARGVHQFVGEARGRVAAA